MASNVELRNIPVDEAGVFIVEPTVEQVSAEPISDTISIIEFNKLLARLEISEKQLKEIRENNELKQATINKSEEGGSNWTQTQYASTPDHVVSVFGGNPLSMIPVFNCDESDYTEVERFVKAIQQIALESRWSDTKKRYALESKLGLKAKAIYFEGLGQDDTIDFDKRILEFVKLFSKKLKADQTQQLFFSCAQKHNESVMAYKLRLVGLSLGIKAKLADNKELYDDFLTNQFVKGLINEIKVEMLKLGPKIFESTVTSAIQMEDIFKTMATNRRAINVLNVPHDNKEVNMPKQDQSINPRQVSGRPVDKLQMNRLRPTCTFCGKVGHHVNVCFRKIRPGSNDGRGVEIWCSICQKEGHWTAGCWYNLDPKEKDCNASSNGMGAFPNK